MTPRRPAALAIGLLLFLTACSGVHLGDEPADSADGDSFAADTPAEAPLAGESATASGVTGDLVDSATSVELAVAVENRRIISRGTVDLQVDELGAAVDGVETLVEDLDGLVFAEDTDLRDGARTQLTIKVPPHAFRAALVALADLGEVQTQTVTTDDVTEAVVDLDSRIATAEASVDRLRLLLTRAERIRDVTQIETQLLQRETDLETLRGQRRTIEGQIALATIDVTLRAERTSPPPPDPVEPAQTGFLDGLRGGTDALRTVAVGLSAVAGALLPWLPVLLVGAFLARRWWWLRSRPTAN